MGLLFNRKTSGGTIYRKNIPSGKITEREIKGIVSELGVVNKATGYKISKGLIRAKESGLKPEEVHQHIQQLITEGKLSEKKGREVSNKLGLEGSNLHYANYYESLAQKKAEAARGNATQHKHLNNGHLKEKPTSDFDAEENLRQEKPRNVWNLINKQKNG